MPELSIIIPVYNDVVALRRLAVALGLEAPPDCEVIVASDGGPPEVEAIASEHGLRFVRSEVCRGAGPARNMGAGVACGEHLIFLDSDVVPVPGMFRVLTAHLAQMARPRSWTGVYDIEPAKPGWFQRYRALVNYSYIMDRPAVSSTSLFVTAVAGIDRALFEQVGGFSTTDLAEDAEDTEFGYRVGRHTHIQLLTDVRVQHNFPDYRTNVFKYYQRSRAWSRLFWERRTFDDQTTSASTAAIKLMGGAAAASVGIALVLPPLAPVAVAANAGYCVANRKFFALAWRNGFRGSFPALYCADLTLAAASSLGGLEGLVSSSLREVRK